MILAIVAASTLLIGAYGFMEFLFWMHRKEKQAELKALEAQAKTMAFFKELEDAKTTEYVNARANALAKKG